MTTIRTGLRIPYEINSKLIMLAKKRGISKNALVLQILWDWIEKEMRWQNESRKVE